MKSTLQPFLTEKDQAGELTPDFYIVTNIPKLRIDSIIKGQCGATIKEIKNVANYFEVPLNTILEMGTPTLVKTRVCLHCDETFIPSNERAIYCSDLCRNRAFRANNK